MVIYACLGGNMESKNVKVIDEHSIDRDASIICGLNLDGIDYVLYSIERDGDNDNLFISRVIKNIDGTSNMVNIEDSMEKNKVNEIVKELITYSIKNEADKANDVVSLSDGKNVKVFGVLFNKEQNINVGKTYVTTVKKSVTKVSEDFYKVELPKVEETNTIFETITEEVNVPKAEEVLPASEEVKVEEPVTPILPDVTPVIPEMPKAEVVEPKVEEIQIPSVEPKIEENIEISPAVAPVIPVAPVVSPVEPVAVPVLPVVEPEIAKEENVQTLDAAPLSLDNDAVIDKPTIPEVTPVIPVAPTPVAPLVETPTVAAPLPATNETKLFFDGSQEVNLNQALGEVSSEKTLPTAVEDVSSLREFGTDSPVVSATPVTPVEIPAETPAEVPAKSETKVLTKSKGFANNKFFMVIAIVVFLGACVFLGYEAFHYFQLVK